MIEAGGYGSMAYVFQWSNSEVFGYLGSQYLWQHTGVPDIDNEDDFSFLDYAYRIYYGDEVGVWLRSRTARTPASTSTRCLRTIPPPYFSGGRSIGNISCWW